ncbi:MAG: RNA-guided endonuclease InsQ/TnpB family protein [Halorhodospira sp.]
MQVLRTYSFRLEPTPAQEQRLRRMAGCARLVWNRGVEITRGCLERGERIPRYKALTSALIAWKAELPFLKEDAYSQALQQSLRDLDQAWQACFDPKRPNSKAPRFKKRGDGDTIRFPQHFKVRGNEVQLPKIGAVSYRNSRRIPSDATAQSVVITREGQHWMVHIQVKRDLFELSTPPADDIVGIDLGVARFLTVSDGTYVDALNERYQQLQKRLAVEQKRLERKEKGSNNRAKQRAKVASVHRKLRNIRHDFCHKVSTHLANSHGQVVVEDLAIGNMTASARGTLEQPGRQVRAKSGLNRSILAQGWGTFRQMLDYKLAERGGRLIRVNPAHTSQQCPECGHTAAGNRPSQAVFRCQACGYQAHADWVGAKNILARGIQELRDEGQGTAGAPAGCLSPA